MPRFSHVISSERSLASARGRRRPRVSPLRARADRQPRAARVLGLHRQQPLGDRDRVARGRARRAAAPSGARRAPAPQAAGAHSGCAFVNRSVEAGYFGQLRRGPDRPRLEVAAAVRADAAEPRLDAVGAERALEGADPRLRRSPAAGRGRSTRSWAGARASAVEGVVQEIAGDVARRVARRAGVEQLARAGDAARRTRRTRAGSRSRPGGRRLRPARATGGAAGQREHVDGHADRLDDGRDLRRCRVSPGA